MTETWFFCRAVSSMPTPPLVGARHLIETRGNLESEEMNVGLA